MIETSSMPGLACAGRPAGEATLVVEMPCAVAMLHPAVRRVITENAEQRRGLQYQWLLQGAPYPQVGLRLAGSGSALIMYGMYLNTSNEHPNLAAGAPIPVPTEFKPLLGAPTEVGYHAVFANWAYQFAAIDPPATARDAKLDIIGSQSGPSFGHAY